MGHAEAGRRVCLGGGGIWLHVVGTKIFVADRPLVAAKIVRSQSKGRLHSQRAAGPVLLRMACPPLGGTLPQNTTARVKVEAPPKQCRQGSWFLESGVMHDSCGVLRYAAYILCYVTRIEGKEVKTMARTCVLQGGWVLSGGVGATTTPFVPPVHGANSDRQQVKCTADALHDSEWESLQPWAIQCPVREWCLVLALPSAAPCCWYMLVLQLISGSSRPPIQRILCTTWTWRVSRTRWTPSTSRTLMINPHSPCPMTSNQGSRWVWGSRAAPLHRQPFEVSGFPETLNFSHFSTGDLETKFL